MPQCLCCSSDSIPSGVGYLSPRRPRPLPEPLNCQHQYDAFCSSVLTVPLHPCLRSSCALCHRHPKGPSLPKCLNELIKTRSRGYKVSTRISESVFDTSDEIQMKDYHSAPCFDKRNEKNTDFAMTLSVFTSCKLHCTYFCINDRVMLSQSFSPFTSISVSFIFSLLSLVPSLNFYTSFRNLMYLYVCLSDISSLFPFS